MERIEKKKQSVTFPLCEKKLIPTYNREGVVAVAEAMLFYTLFLLFSRSDDHIPEDWFSDSLSPRLRRPSRRASPRHTRYYFWRTLGVFLPLPTTPSLSFVLTHTRHIAHTSHVSMYTMFIARWHSICANIELSFYNFFFFLWESKF